MKEKPIPPPEPLSELEILREQVRELTAVKTGYAFGHATYCGHAQHPTMTALAEQIAEKVNWRGEALRHRAAIERVRELADTALATWEPEHTYRQERAERKGYAHDETAAEIYGLAIEAVTAILAVLDQLAGKKAGPVKRTIEEALDIVDGEFAEDLPVKGGEE